MFFTKRRKTVFAVVSAVWLAGAGSFAYAVQAAYIPTNRDTKLPPDKVSYDIVKVDEFEKLYETDTLIYYYREDRDVIAVCDKRSGYIWKTGLDIPFGNDVKQAVMDAETPEEAEALAIPIEADMNTTYTGISNSILTVEYNEDDTVKYMSSASRDMVESELVTLNGNPATRRLDVNFKNLEVEVKVYITFGEDSIQYEIRDEDITGKGTGNIVALEITPFLGASGGKVQLYDPETGMYDVKEDKYMAPGYIMVPDGSGSLIRFQKNSAKFSMYVGDVYGEDPAQDSTYQTKMSDMIPLRNPVMPVFGVAHGDGQAAFVAYADEGAEYMQIAVRPEGNLTNYYYVYPRFVRNVSYYQVYNKKGEGFFTLMAQPNKMDIKMTYTFLAGDGQDGTPAADYTGMALTYRSHLIEEGILTEQPQAEGDIPIRLDFIMSDVKKSVIGTEAVTVTTVDDVREILNTVAESGISNVNAGLQGWQRGGETLASPGSSRYSSKCGTAKEFQNLITEFSEKGIDISYARDYTTINKEMMNYRGNAVKHINSWYLDVDKSAVVPENSPVTNYGYATPEKSVKWFHSQLSRVSSYCGSMTVSGMSNILLSNYDMGSAEITVTETIELYEKTFEDARKELKLNFEAPNMYLWKYTDRYLQSPVGTSQYVFETDAVPFLQMVLNGTMEVYAPYSNFSFYTQADILRMIDYNLSPSFILSEEPSYYLAATPSAHLYSTEFEQYEALIQNVYGQVNEALSQVVGYRWVERTVLENGVIMNTYRKDGGEGKYIIINYSEDVFTYKGNTVAPLSAAVISERQVQ